MRLAAGTVSMVNGDLPELSGDIGTSSFYPPHHMTMGEGGAVYTIMLYYIRSFVPFVTGDGTVYALPDGIICVDTGLMGSMENYPWATIINMSTPFWL